MRTNLCRQLFGQKDKGAGLMVTRKFSLDTLGMIFVYTFVSLVAAMMLYPVLNVLAVSFSDYVEYVRNPWMLIPRGVNLQAYIVVFHNPLIYSSFQNSIFITCFGTVLTLIMTILYAWPLSRPEVKGKAIFMTYLIITMVFNAGMIPNFLNIRSLGLLNSRWALILPGLLGAWHCILMLNFFRKMPASLVEAAKIDGAGELYILLRIVIPLSGPVIAAIALFNAVGYWNSFFGAMIYLRTRDLWPLAMLLREILLEARTSLLNAGGNIAEIDMAEVSPITLQYAMLMTSMLPIMCVYPFLQKYFAKGVLVGSIKG